MTPKSNGNLPQKLGNCPSDANFANAHLIPEYSCQDELLMPAGVKQLPNFFISFADITAGNGGDCSHNGKCFAAAYLFCEIQNLTFASPVVNNNAKIQAGDITALVASWGVTANRIGSKNCYARLKDRIKCGADAGASIKALGGGGDNCNQSQIKACKHLHDDMHITDQRLDECIAGAGMSPYLLRKIETLAPCTNRNYATQINPANQGDYHSVQGSLEKCVAEQAKFAREEDQCSLNSMNMTSHGMEWEGENATYLPNPGRGTQGP
jgi:hypothetical protein